MKKFEPTCYRYKSDKEYENDLIIAKYDAEQKGIDPDTITKVRTTKDIKCTVETYYMNATPDEPRKGRRMVKLRVHKGNEYHMPAKDWSLILQDLEFDVRDVR